MGCNCELGDLLKVCVLDKHLTRSKVAFVVIVSLIVDSLVSYLFVKVVCIVLHIFSNMATSGTNVISSDLL